MSAVGSAAKPASCFCRRAHSPPATSAAASSAPKNSRRPRADQAGLDGIFDEEDAAERQRHAADPDRPAGAEFFLEADDAFGLRRLCGAVAAARLRLGLRRWRLASAREAARQPRLALPERASGSGEAAAARASAAAPRPARRRARFKRGKPRLDRAQAIVDVDRLDQRHDGDDRKRQQHQAEQNEEFHDAPPRGRILGQPSGRR